MGADTQAQSPELRYYDQLAGRYHDLHRQPVQAYHVETEGRVVRRLIPTGARIAVVGCGGGREFAFLPADAREVVGADFSAAMLREAESELALLRARGVERTELVQADAARLPFFDGHFDVVLCLASLNYMPSYREAVVEMARILRPGGVLLINVINRLELAARLKAVPRTLRERARRGDTAQRPATSAFRELFTESELLEMVKAADVEPTETIGVRLLVDLIPDAWNGDPRKRRRAERLIRVLGPVELALLRLPWCRRRARFVLVCGMRLPAPG